MNTGQHIHTQKISISLHLLMGVGKVLVGIAIGVLGGFGRGVVDMLVGIGVGLLVGVEWVC